MMAGGWLRQEARNRRQCAGRAADGAWAGFLSAGGPAKALTGTPASQRGVGGNGKQDRLAGNSGGTRCGHFQKPGASFTLSAMAAPTFQPPKGTRDFYPDSMAVRRYIEDIWRRVSIRHGFVEVDGPTFESMDLYRVKSGEEIVSQLFYFVDRAARELALRPEFTPTLARMVAEKAQGLPRPIKWFAIPRCYRAEQPQKGRLREFMQWNVDFIGDATPRSDQEVLMLCVDALREFGLTTKDFRIGWNHRELMTQALVNTFVKPDRIGDAYFILDRLGKLSAAARSELYTQRNCDEEERGHFEMLADAISQTAVAGPALETLMASWPAEVRNAIAVFEQKISDAGMADYCRFDIGVVRGLAYYTGFVFEVMDSSGENRAIAGGGRYDRLIEMFGGPALPAVGFGMGDVVLEIVLRERGKLPANLLPRPDVFVVNALENGQPAARLVTDLRVSQWSADGQHILRPGLHVVESYRSTKNIGKLLQEAAASEARLAVILAEQEYQRGVLKIKNLRDRNEREVPVSQAVEHVHAALEQAGPEIRG
jgi:histidyl-tRNA synthetase